MIQALSLSALVFYSDVQIWQILLLSVFLGVIEAFESPVRHSFIFDMVDKKEEIGNAIALNSAMFNGARLIGPGIAGFMVAQFGEAYCFLINGLSYIAVLISLFNMRIHASIQHISKGHFIQNFKEGFSYVIQFQPIRYLLINVSIFTLLGSSYTVLLPYYAREVFKGDAKTLGYLMSGIGAGALCGAVYLASRKHLKGLGSIITNMGHIAAICLIIVSFSKIFYLSLFLVFVAGCGMMMQMAGSNTIIQNIVDADKRGRVMGIYSMSFLSFMPIGSLLVGTISKSIGVEKTLFLSGSLCFLGSFILHFKLPLIREKIREKFRNQAQ